MLEGICKTNSYRIGVLNVPLYEEYNYINGQKNGNFICKYHYKIVTGLYVNNTLIEKTETSNNNNLLTKIKKISDKDLYKIEKFYMSGELCEVYYNDCRDRQIGEYIKYYKNGQIEAIKNYKPTNNHGTKMDIIKRYYDNGNIKEESIFNDDNVIIGYNTYHINSKISSKKIIKVGEFNPYLIETYDENGLLVYYKNTDCKLEYNFVFDDKNKNTDINNYIKIFAQKLLDSIN